MAKLWLTEEVLSREVKKSRSFRETVINLGMNPHGGNIQYVTKKIRKLDIDTRHFYGGGKKLPWNKGMKGSAPYRKKKEEILIKHDGEFLNIPAVQLRRAMRESKIPYKCNNCGANEWNGMEIRLEINHIDGNRLNCLLQNLEFLCPNCHSQTDKYKNYKRRESER